MTSKILAAAVAGVMSLSAASGAWAQQAAAAAPAVTHGPAIAGVCMLSLEGAIGTSTVGRYVQTRMDQLVQEVNTELSGERTAIETEGKTLESQRATLDRATLERRAEALQTRANTLAQRAALREREIQATQQKALARIGQEMDPLVRQAYQQRSCSVLLNRDAVLFANPQMDLTPGVVTALNGKLTQFTVTRERLDQAAAPAQTGAAATR